MRVDLICAFGDTISAESVGKIEGRVILNLCQEELRYVTQMLLKYIVQQGSYSYNRKESGRQT
jgi:hypothetical protein